MTSGLHNQTPGRPTGCDFYKHDHDDKIIVNKLSDIRL